MKTPQNSLIAGGVIVGFLLLAYLLATEHISQSLLLGIGLLLGYTLFHARFGFTGAFRRMMSVGNGQAMRSHMLMLTVAVTLFAPILAYGVIFFGSPVAGYISPVGISLVVSAFMFGIGMQHGSGCASGTLYAIGGGRSVVFVTLGLLVVGSTIGAYHLPFWTEEMPAFAPFCLAASTGLGYGGAWLGSIVFFGLVGRILLVIEKKKKAPKMAPIPTEKGWKRIFRGSWPMFAAAIILAVLNALTLMTHGEPWGILALAGTFLALYLRPLFGLSVPKSSDSVC